MMRLDHILPAIALNMACIILAAAICFFPAVAICQEYRGVNLAGAEFNYSAKRKRDVHGKNYIYPGTLEIKHFAAQGMNVARLPVRWERLQPELGHPLSAAEIERIDRVILDARNSGMSVIIDVHNFGKYKGASIGTPEVPVDAFVDLWQRLAVKYRSVPGVMFGMMNEPFDIDATSWAATAQATLLAIREVNAKNMVLVPGTAWSGAHSWWKPMRGISNARALKDFYDPANNFAFDFHQYFDAHSSGTQPNCISTEQAVARLSVATEWLAENNKKGFLSEFAASRTYQCQLVLAAALAHLKANKNWTGWTYWASSAWFGDYMFNIYPASGSAPVQMKTIAPYLIK
jgi:endoglucanase